MPDKREILIDTPGVILRLTPPDMYLLGYDAPVEYVEREGDGDVPFRGIVVGEREYSVDREDLEINEEEKTIKFESDLNEYMIRPTKEGDDDYIDKWLLGEDSDTEENENGE